MGAIDCSPQYEAHETSIRSREDSMATDTRSGKPLTIADLSEAIADGRISHTRREDVYEISALDIRRYRRSAGHGAQRSLHVDPYLTSAPAQESSCQM
jgi:hypothetical protein